MPFSTALALGTEHLLQLLSDQIKLIDQTRYLNMPINVMDMLTMFEDDLKVMRKTNIFRESRNILQIQIQVIIIYH